MTPHLIEIVLLMMAFFLLGCLIGNFLRRWTMGNEASPELAPNDTPAGAAPVSEVASQDEKPAPAPKAAVAETSAAAPKAAPKPETAAEPAAAEKSAPASKPAAKTPAAAKSATKAPAKKAAPKKAAPKSAASKSTVSKKATGAKPASKPAADDKPNLLSAPRNGQQDDLKTIKGIGPKIEKILNEKGIYHFDQIATWKRKDVNWVDGELSFKGRIDREEWVKQAKALAKAQK